MKGKCSNERGITLASNVGKVYERIKNERVKKQVNITNAQAGRKHGCSTVDHLIVLKQSIDEITANIKTAYIIFLDVQKAYNKAWLDAILYALYQNGIEGKNLRTIKNLNSNLTARIQPGTGYETQTNITLDSLLWMDDVCLIHHNPDKLQKILNITNHVANNYHTQFGAAKCKVVKEAKEIKAPLR